MHLSLPPTRRRSPRPRTGWPRLAAVTGLALPCLLMAACSQGNGRPGGSATPTASPVRTVGPSCGSVSALLVSGSASDGASGAMPRPMACFLAAYAVCTPKTLGFTAHGVDTGVTHTFSLQRSGAGRCAVADDAQTYSANFGGSHGPVQHFACAGVLARDGALIVQGCGAEGNITIPATAIPFSLGGTPTSLLLLN
jgi:hypothetical protein